MCNKVLIYHAKMDANIWEKVIKEGRQINQPCEGLYLLYVRDGSQGGPLLQDLWSCEGSQVLLGDILICEWDVARGHEQEGPGRDDEAHSSRVWRGNQGRYDQEQIQQQTVSLVESPAAVIHAHTCYRKLKRLKQLWTTTVDVSR